MKNHLYYLTAGLLVSMLAAGTAEAQVYSESALLFSTHRYGGAARYQAFGGAGTALGGDISAAYVNPAGLGFNRKSELSISPTLQAAFSSNDYLGNNGIRGSRTTPTLSNFGITVASENPGKQAFKGGTFAITYSNVNNFNQEVYYEGLNRESFLADQAFFDSEGILVHDILLNEVATGNIIDLAGLAFDTYLLNPVFELAVGGNPNDVVAFNDAYTTVRFEPNYQTQSVTTKGGQRVWNFSYGANFKDRIYVGASVKLESIRYERERVYTEEAEERLYELSSLEYTENLQIEGQGIGMTLGAIGRINDYVRLGVSFTTPTIYTVTDIYQADLIANYNDTNILSSPFFFEGEEYVFDYRVPRQTMESTTGELETTYTLYTPYRANAGLSVFLGKLGFITADLEYVGYSSMSFRNDELQNTFESENDFVTDNYNNTINLRMGAEMRLKPIYLRAGFQYYGDPEREISDLGGTNVGVSGGIGYRNADFYIDLALTARFNQKEVSPYFGGNLTPIATVRERAIRSVISFGTFF